MKALTNKYFSLVFLLLSALITPIVNADPPDRVARLSYASGSVSFSPAGESTWFDAIVNRPLTIHDRLWTDKNGRAELQLGFAKIRIGSESSVTLLNLNNRAAQFHLAQGKLHLRIWKIKPNQLYEIDTPSLAFNILKAGSYRVDVDSENDVTTVGVKEGQGIVYGEGASYIIGAKQSCVFRGADLRDYTCAKIASADDFDRWYVERDAVTKNSVSARYVSEEVIGYEDLDSYGSWREIADYGYAWTPTNVSVDWVPYRVGHWIWIEPWGWTWIEDEPWGFAPFHYGRWVFFEGIWFWVPGPRIYEPVYAPALVVFIGLSDFAIGADIGWFPLGPGDIFIPSYRVGRDYFTKINISNTTISVANVSRVFDNPNQKFTYRNQAIANAVSAVPNAAFVNSEQVKEAAIDIPKSVTEKARIRHIVAVAPEQNSLSGSARPSSQKPSNEVLSKPAITKTTPPPAPASFSERKSKLSEHPGQPLGLKEWERIKPKTAVLPELKLVSPTPSAKLVQPEASKIKKQKVELEQQAIESQQQQQQQQEAAEARKAEESRQATAQQQAAEARKAEESRQAAAQQAAEARKAEESRQAAAQQAAEVRKAEESRQATAQQQAAEVRKAEESRQAAQHAEVPKAAEHLQYQSKGSDKDRKDKDQD